MFSLFSYVQLFVTPWTVAHQAPLSMGLSGKNTGVGCHFLLQGIISTQGSNPCLLHLLCWQAGSLTTVPPGEPTVGQNHLTQAYLIIKYWIYIILEVKTKWLFGYTMLFSVLVVYPMTMTDWESIIPLITREGKKKSRFKIQHIVSNEA